jgi:DNA-directed RNA polymerase subunit K/omega
MIRLRRYKSDKQPIYSYLTKFEKALAIGMRANRIAVDPTQPCLIYIKNETDVQRLAELELEENVLPLVIRRTSPDGKEFEDWIFDDDQHLYKDLNTDISSYRFFDQTNGVTTATSGDDEIQRLEMELLIAEKEKSIDKEFHYSFITGKVEKLN